jgi:PadR family transcriptional regulator PadR
MQLQICLLFGAVKAFRHIPVAAPQERVILLWACHREAWMSPEKLDLLQGTLDLMVLQTLAAMGTQHGYGIARRIEQVSGDEVLLNQGTIYASLVRLEQRGWIDSNWGVSGNNRKAKFYAITKTGRQQLAADTRYWGRLTDVMDRVLAMRQEGEEGAGIA